MSLFKNKCEYCKKKIDKGKETFREVKIPGFTEKRKKAFCCEEHVNMYEREISSSKCGKSCCG